MINRKLTIILLVALFSISCTGTLQNYRPQTPEESEIKEALTAYETIYNKHDSAAFLALFHDSAQIMSKRDRSMVSKKQYSGMTFEIFKEFPTVLFGRPYVLVLDSKDKAVVEAVMDFETTKLASKISYIKENNQWRIWKIIYF